MGSGINRYEQYDKQKHVIVFRFVSVRTGNLDVMKKYITERKWDKLYDEATKGFSKKHWRKDRLRDYKLRHLKIGTVKNLNKEKFSDFKIENISWDVHWMTNLYLAVIIRDYLRFFRKHTPAIGNCVWKDYDEMFNSTPEESDAAADRWNALVESVADEFDELAKYYRDEYEDVDWEEREEKRIALTKKAFADLAFIFDDLGW